MLKGTASLLMNGRLLLRRRHGSKLVLFCEVHFKFCHRIGWGCVHGISETLMAVVMTLTLVVHQFRLLVVYVGLHHLLLLWYKFGTAVVVELWLMLMLRNHGSMLHVHVTVATVKTARIGVVSLLVYLLHFTGEVLVVLCRALSEATGNKNLAGCCE